MNDYRPEPVKANIVPTEGIYLCKIGEVTTGISEKDGATWYRVDTIINSEGSPHVSLFLTEGRNFNANATCLFDTFGITRGNFNFDTWRDKRGYLRITFKQNGQYKNMVPHYLLDENGYVKKPDAAKAPPKNCQPEVCPPDGTYCPDDMPEDIPF